MKKVIYGLVLVIVGLLSYLYFNTSSVKCSDSKVQIAYLKQTMGVFNAIESVKQLSRQYAGDDSGIPHDAKVCGAVGVYSDAFGDSFYDVKFALWNEGNEFHIRKIKPLSSLN